MTGISTVPDVTASERIPPRPVDLVLDPKSSYNPEQDALKDIPGLRYALELFLSSHMVEAEDYCNEMDPDKKRLYFATGYSLIQFVKALMSYEDQDLTEAITHARHGNEIADQHRKKSRYLSFPLRLVGKAFKGGVGWYESMTPMERHAELVYTESLYEKALLAIVHSGDWLAFLRETLNLRTIITNYRELGAFIEAMDAEAQARGEPEDKSIDTDFRSGVYLGVGFSHLILSMMPGKILAIVEFFGYKGDRMTGLAYLNKSGGWSSDSLEPGISKDEGIRRSISDMCLLIFHLFLSGMTSNGVDIKMAEKVLDWNLERYPNGVFFLFAQGRMSLVRGQPDKAIEYYEKATAAQQQYRNLHHASSWEIAIANLALWDISKSLDCWNTLKREATWSKAIYAFGVAICTLHLYEQGNKEKKKEEILKLFAEVPLLVQRIAGKSIPLEKFVAKRAKKFQEQGGRLCLAALEMTYVFSAIAHAPKDVVASKMLPRAREELENLKTFKDKPEAWGNGQGYWDDYCLCRFLEGVCERYLAYPDPNTVSKNGASYPGAEERAAAAFEEVLSNGTKIQGDHYLVFYTHYEYGRLLVCQGDKTGALEHFGYVSAGSAPESNPAGWSGKYSLESALNLRTHAATESLGGRPKD